MTDKPRRRLVLIPSAGGTIVPVWVPEVDYNKPISKLEVAIMVALLVTVTAISATVIVWALLS